MAAHTRSGTCWPSGSPERRQRGVARRGAARPGCSGSSSSTAGRSPSTRRSTRTRATSATSVSRRRVPAHLFGFGMALLAGRRGGLAPAAAAAFTAAYGVCFVMSVLYSVPPFRFKAVAGVDWLINMIGFGALTPVRGLGPHRPPARPAGVAGRSPPSRPSSPRSTRSPRSTSSRRTGAAATGRWPSCSASGPSLLLAIGGDGRGVRDVRRGRGGQGLVDAGAGRRLARAGCWLSPSWPGWSSCSRGWSAAATMTPAEHQRGMYAALAAWAVTDVAVAVGFGLG